MTAESRPAPDVRIREATAADNESLIALELESPLRMGDIEETYDRSPDYFACQRVLPEHRVVLGEVAGRAAGAMVGVLQEPMIQGRPTRLVYIRQARVHPDFHGRRVAWLMANDLFAWAGARGAKGPYYLIAPGNEPSLAFVERGGGRWPLDVRLLELDVAAAQGERPQRLTPERLEEAVRLVNATHGGEEMYEPLTVESFATRLGRDRSYGIGNLYAALEAGALVAVAGLWDKGATTAQLHFDRSTGVTARSRGAVVVDWGFAPGRGDAFGGLLRRLAAEARALGRSALMVCEPSAGALPDIGLPAHKVSVSLFTPAMPPPATAAIRGLYVDMLQV